MYHEYLAEEVSAQRNAVLDELAISKTELRISAITIASLETELFHVKDDLSRFGNELDAVYGTAEAMGQYITSLEKNADKAMAESQQRLRQRIDVLQLEIDRLSALVSIEGISVEIPFQGEEGEQLLLETSDSALASNGFEAAQNSASNASGQDPLLIPTVMIPPREACQRTE